MKITAYIKDHLFEIGVFFFSLILLEYLFIVFQLRTELNFFYLTISTLTFIICLLASYYRKYCFYQELIRVIKDLDQKYLAHELITEPETRETKLIYEALSEIDRSMIEYIAQYKTKHHDFKEYLELWIHEVKLPLASLQLLYDSKSDPRIRLQLGRLDNYLNQILYFARSEHVEKDYQISSCNLANIINRVAVKNRDILLKSKIEFIAKDLDYSVETDSKWLEFIINQIMDNSLKYRKKRNPQIKIFAVDKPKVLELHVFDNGIGIPLADQSRIFQKSFTGENGRIQSKNQDKINLLAETEYLRSTGMGLYIVKKLIKKLGHRISVSSTENEYTELIIYFSKNDYYKNVRKRNIKSTTKPK